MARAYITFYLFIACDNYRFSAHEVRLGNILTSRLVLNLKNVGSTSTGHSTNSESHAISTRLGMRFATNRTLATVGAPLAVLGALDEPGSEDGMAAHGDKLEKAEEC